MAVLQIQHRLAFSQDQAAEYQAISSSLAVTTFPSKLAAWIANTFFATPAFYDIGNYSKELAQAILIYGSNILHHFFSGWYFGLITLFIGLFGLILSLRKFKSLYISTNNTFLVLLIISILQTAFSIFLLPITFQRYYLLNLALSMMWVSIGLSYLYSSIIRSHK